MGLRRRGFSNETIEAIHNAYRIIYQSGLNNTEALKKIENDEIVVEHTAKKHEDTTNQIGFGDGIANEIADELKNMDVTTYTPIEAMNKLYELANRAKEI